MHKRTLTTSAAGAALVLAVTAGAAGAADSDSLNGTVVIAAPAEACITIDLDGFIFGALAGNAFSTPESNNILGSGAATAENCSSADETFLVRSTDGVGNQGAAWSLYDPFSETGGPATSICDHGLDRVRLGAVVTDTDPDSGTFVLTTDRSLNGADTNDPVLAGTTRTIQHELTMPCQGSSGADGESVSFQLTYTAVLAP